MTPAEARDRFSEAHEGDLPPEERAAFDRLLAEDAGLRADYEAFVALLAAARAAGAASPPPRPLLPGVQAKLRRRSRGRYYRDRFAERSGTAATWGLAVAALVLLVALGLGLAALLAAPPGSLLLGR